MKRFIGMIGVVLAVAGCGGNEQPTAADTGTAGPGADAGSSAADAAVAGPDAGSSGQCVSGTSTCAQDARGKTALELLNSWKGTIASPDAKWMGGLQGQYVGRDGKLNGTAAEGTFWQGNFCAPQELFHFETTMVTDQACTQQRSCQQGPCTGFDYALPAVDSAAAILAAFPDDGADARYGVMITCAIKRVWNVSRVAEGSYAFEFKKVDADTGQVVP